MDVIRTANDHRIAKELFRDYTTSAAISRKLYPWAFSHKAKIGKSKNLGVVSKVFSNLQKADFLESKTIFIEKKRKNGTDYTQSFPGYRLNLNIFYEYSKDKFRDRKSKFKGFNIVEKRILEYIFSFSEVRDIIARYDNLFDGITSFLERVFFYKSDTDWPDKISDFFRKGFFVKNKKYLKLTSDIVLDRFREIEEFEKISRFYFRNLRFKIEKLINFTDKDYFNLTINESLRKYQYMPSLSEIRKNKEKSVLWSKIYFDDEAPKGW